MRVSCINVKTNQQTNISQIMAQVQRMHARTDSKRAAAMHDKLIAKAVETIRKPGTSGNAADTDHLVTAALVTALPAAKLLQRKQINLLAAGVIGCKRMAGAREPVCKRGAIIRQGRNSDWTDRRKAFQCGQILRFTGAQQKAHRRVRQWLHKGSLGDVVWVLGASAWFGDAARQAAARALRSSRGV